MGRSRVHRGPAVSGRPACPANGRTRVASAGTSPGSGFTLVEVMFTVSIAIVLAGITMPVSRAALDDLQTAGAARYVAGLVFNARMDALKRSRSVGFRFEPAGNDYVFRTFVDGNGNGLRTIDIRNGSDGPLDAPQRLADHFPGVRFGLRTGVPDADGVQTASTDGLRIGAARILAAGPDGTATSGTLYVQGRRAQYAVRVLGATARTRVLKFESGAGSWTSR
ncbi:MAG: prepilin-type N-terminal cleavage/methylation domain-containing protein [Acidobacteriota bacterium]|nr:prepilin-type N-terminal cleavage/methylation domain-containing protein [Acidobacteriota bacterium]